MLVCLWMMCVSWSVVLVLFISVLLLWYYWKVIVLGELIVLVFRVSEVCLRMINVEGLFMVMLKGIGEKWVSVFWGWLLIFVNIFLVSMCFFLLMVRFWIGELKFEESVVSSLFLVESFSRIGLLGGFVLLEGSGLVVMKIELFGVMMYVSVVWLLREGGEKLLFIVLLVVKWSSCVVVGKVWLLCVFKM